MSRKKKTEDDEADELQRLQYDEDLRAVMRTVPGRRVMFRIIEDTAALSLPSFTGNNDETNWREGKRAVGVYLNNEIKRVAAPEFVHMRREALEEAETRLLKESAENGRERNTVQHDDGDGED